MLLCCSFRPDECEEDFVIWGVGGAFSSADSPISQISNFSIKYHPSSKLKENTTKNSIIIIRSNYERLVQESLGIANICFEWESSGEGQEKVLLVI